WETVGKNIKKYRSYPRIVGETGGKDFIFMHSSADSGATATAMVRGAFEYQGQKCSAASRAYIPESRWREIKKRLGDQIGRIKMGDPEDFRNFMNAVIDKSAYGTITGYIDHAKKNGGAKIIYGGKYTDQTGYFIEPTVILAKKANYKSMEEEIFGPVLSVYVYPEKRFAETLKVCDRTSPYALTGAIMANDRAAIRQASETLIHAAGNFYINDKPTGAVVGQQPFGGSRASGTNDKAGSFLNLIRWISTRTTKELLLPPTDFPYPFMNKN
ncbi:MAG: aldehyde dehydrogenase family protein, partial [Elusimicrobiota bacterium]